MSGSIFGDDDDFELVAGSDTPSAARKPPAAKASPRPVAPRTPAAPVPPAAQSQNRGTRPTPPASQSSALPRPTLPAPVKTPTPENNTRRPLPTNRATERPVAPPAPAAPVRTTAPASGDTTRRNTEAQLPPAAPAPRPTIPATPPAQEPAAHYDPYADESPSAPPTSTRQGYAEEVAAAPAPATRRSLRDEPDDRYRQSPDDYREPLRTRAHEDNPGNLYSRIPYAEENDAQPTRSAPPLRPEPVEETHHPEPAEPKRKGKGKNSRPAKGRAEKANKGPGSFSGGRNGVLIVRIFAIALVAALMLAGAKSIFFPPQIPDPTTVTNVVKKRIGITNFPVESGKAFVTSFAKIYFTIDATASNKNDVFAPYMNSSLASNMPVGNGTDTKQTVSEGPIISGVKSVDDSNAVYTVAARLNSATNWVYIDVPVYYDSDKAGFAVSGMPAFAPAPTKIDAPPAGSPFEQDTLLANDIQKSVMEQFFPAWAASDINKINLVVLKDANNEAKIGLGNSVKYSSIQSFTVEKKQTDDPDETTRKAQATIVWASPTDAKITYTQKYNMVLYRQPDNRWYIKELTSGVRS